MTHPDIESRLQRIYNAAKTYEEISRIPASTDPFLPILALALEQLGDTLSDIKRIADALDTRVGRGE